MSHATEWGTPFSSTSVPPFPCLPLLNARKEKVSPHRHFQICLNVTPQKRMGINCFTSHPHGYRALPSSPLPHMYTQVYTSMHTHTWPREEPLRPLPHHLLSSPPSIPTHLYNHLNICDLMPRTKGKETCSGDLSRQRLREAIL